MGAADKVYIRYSIVVRKEGKQYSSWCPELDVASSGENVEQACRNLEEAVNCFLKTYSALGELKQMLVEKGITLGDENECPSLFLSEARIGVTGIA